MQQNHQFDYRALAQGLVISSGLILAAVTQAGAHWGYSGHEGPMHWGELDPEYVLCGTGETQAPIDIHDAIDTDLPAIELHYQPGGRDEINNGHTIRIDYEPGSYVHYEDRDYRLKQFHFHAPSENHIDGHEFPLEAHLVHVDEAGHLLVIAVMFETGKHNQELAVAWQDMPEQPHTHHVLHTPAFAGSLLPKSRDYYRFDGSLTTPPCSEGVVWLVMKEPVTASREQISHFARVMGHPNNRPVQPLNGRVVKQ